jgi:uncharacterized membrane protein
MKSFLVHPIFVHFPIALFFLELLLLALWTVQKDGAYHRFAEFSFWAAYLFLWFSAVTGLWDHGGFADISGTAAPHFYSALGMLFFYSARAFYWKKADRHAANYAVFQIGGAALGNVLIVFVAYFGGRLVYS